MSIRYKSIEANTVMLASIFKTYCITPSSLPTLVKAAMV